VLAREQLHVKAPNTMNDIAERDLKIPVRKNLESNSSRGGKRSAYRQHWRVLRAVWRYPTSLLQAAATGVQKGGSRGALLTLVAEIRSDQPRIDCRKQLVLINPQMELGTGGADALFDLLRRKYLLVHRLRNRTHTTDCKSPPT